MTEKEKAALGQLYDANGDPALLREREAAKEALYDYNHTRPSQGEERLNMLRALLGEVRGDAVIEPPFQCDYGYNITVGKDFYANVGCVILDGARVDIGDHVFLAPYVGIYTAGHPMGVEERNRGLEYAYPITIGDNVWIGAGCSILPGVTIGSNAVIGAGSVVNRDIPPSVLAAGNPCKVIRQL